MNRNHQLLNHIMGRLNQLNVTQHVVNITNVHEELYVVRLKQLSLSAKDRANINSMPEIKEIGIQQFGQVEITFNYSEVPMIGVSKPVEDIKPKE